METGLVGKVAVVSGGSGPIGRAIALRFSAEGAAVAVTWRFGEDRAAEVVDSIVRGGGRARAVQLDQRDRRAARAALEQVRQTLGVVSVLVASAVDRTNPELEEIEGLADSLSANTVGTAGLIDAALPDMRAAKWGRVVILSTDIVGQPLVGALPYAAAKAALETTARVLAVREARHGIFTNVVRPGVTLTDRALEFALPVVEKETAHSPTGRICTPEDVASAVTYLGSAANGHINGQVLSVAGGRELVR